MTCSNSGYAHRPSTWRPERQACIQQCAESHTLLNGLNENLPCSLHFCPNRVTSVQLISTNFWRNCEFCENRRILNRYAMEMNTSLRDWRRPSPTWATVQTEIQHSRVLQSSSRDIQFATRWELLCCMNFLVCTPYFTKKLSLQQERAKTVYFLFVIKYRISGIRPTTFTQISF